MQMPPSKAMLLAMLLALINGPAIAGNGKVSGGGVARTIESNQSLARNVQLEEQLRRGSDTPPCREPRPMAGRFILA